MAEQATMLEHALRRPATLVADAGVADAVAQAEIAAAVARYLRPLEVVVTGRAGAGRRTVARALTDRLGVVADVGEGGAADLRCHVLAGPPRAADLRILHAREMPTVVVVAKSDLLDTDDLAGLLRRCHRALGCAVTDVVALWAAVDLDDEDLRLLAALGAAGECVPSMTAHFVLPTGIHDEPAAERRGRIRLLRRLGPTGVEMALGILAGADGPVATASQRDRIVASLAAASGFGVVQAMIAGHVEDIRRARLAELRTRLDRLAAAGVERLALERLLGPVPW